MQFEGVWNIFEMEMWSEEYFNMEVQAFIKINNNGEGTFQFGLVTGGFIGKIINKDNCEKFTFKWIGTDELEPVYGTCCMEIINENLLLGRFVFDNDEESDFKARKQLKDPINDLKNWM